MNKKAVYHFTIIELLVVISIISVLVTLLLPALNKAKESSTRIACVNNLKQQYLAFSSYAGDFDGRLPGTPRTPYASATISHYNGNLLSYRYYVNEYLNIKTKQSGDNDIRTGPLSDVLTCPANPLGDWSGAHWKGHVMYSVIIGGLGKAGSDPAHAHPRLGKMGTTGPKGPKMLSCDSAAFQGTNNSFSYNWEKRNNHKLRGGNVLAGDGSARWVPLSSWPQIGFSGEGTLLPSAEYYVYMGSTGWNTNWYWYEPNGTGGGKIAESPTAPSLFY